MQKSHGDPTSPERHVGDLGNLMAFRAYGGDKPTDVFIFDNLITLEDGKDNSIIGRAFVVHAKADDLGRGGNEESLKTGNAGARLACGIVQKM